MPFPKLLFALWALWPIAAYPGGKLFAPMVVLIGLFGLRQLTSRSLKLPVMVALTLLVWICFSALWSPADEGLFSGSLLAENFALEASYLRFAFTLIGCFLFVGLILNTESEKLVPSLAWIYAGIALHFAVVVVIAVFRHDLLASQGGWMVATGQSMGRNANLLMLSVPLLLGGLVLNGVSKRRLLAGGTIIVLAAIIAIQLDSLAAVMAIAMGGVAFLILYFAQKNGFRWLFNSAAAATLFAPALAWSLNAISPSIVGALPLTAQQRILIWQATLERILEKPFIGHGVNAAPTWTETYVSRPDLLEKLAPELINHRIIPSHPHNMALQIWAETGLVGAVLGAAVFVLVGQVLPAPRDLSLAIKAAAGGLFGAALSYFAVSYSVWDESFWASVAIIFSGIIVLQRKVAS